MARARWLLVLIVAACSGSGGDGGGGPAHAGSGGAEAHTSVATGEAKASAGASTSPWCPGGVGGGNACSCYDDYDSIGECICMDSCWCYGCPIGICGTNFEADREDEDVCLEQHCCGEVASCVVGGEPAASQSCRDCMREGGGPLCDALLACARDAGCVDSPAGGGGADGGPGGGGAASHEGGGADATSGGIGGL